MDSTDKSRCRNFTNFSNFTVEVHSELKNFKHYLNMYVRHHFP